MKNIIRILATDELKALLMGADDKFGAKTEFFSDGEGRLTERIACIQPDAVIMNLFMPEADAIEIIKAYRLLYADSFTYFAVIVPFLTVRLKNELDECGVNRVISCPYHKRDFDALVLELAQLKATPLATLKSSGINTVHMLHHTRRSDSPDLLDEVRNEIEAVFDALGLNKNDIGCIFLRRAVMLALDVERRNLGITKSIYPVVADEFGTTPSCVERRIRGAISEAWRSERSALIISYFGYTVDNMRGRPTNAEFIATLADRIRLDMAQADVSKA